MKNQSIATRFARQPLSRPLAGLAWGALGVLAFSFTVPFTRFAVDGLSPLFIGAGRAVVAGVLAALALTLLRQPWPSRRQWPSIAVVAMGVVVGFPLLTSFALTAAPASHGAVVIALLPAMTAVTAVVRGKERPPLRFWIMAAIGGSAAIVFAAVGAGGSVGLHWSDVLLFGAVIAAAIGYAEGGLLSRELGAWQTVSWALVLALPAMTAVTAITVSADAPAASPWQWAAFAYLATVSMFLGFFAWYRGLAIGPMARVSQVQLAQPVLSILWAALLLGERLTVPIALGGLAVVACAGAAIRVRQQKPVSIDRGFEEASPFRAARAPAGR